MQNCDQYQVIWLDSNVNSALNVVYQEAFKALGFANLICMDNLASFQAQHRRISEKQPVILIVSGLWAAPSIKIIKQGRQKSSKNSGISWFGTKKTDSKNRIDCCASTASTGSDLKTKK